jgi:hypothetical protein
MREFKSSISGEERDEPLQVSAFEEPTSEDEGTTPVGAARADVDEQTAEPVARA